MNDSTILLLFPGIFALAIGIVVFLAAGPSDGTSYFKDTKKSPLGFRTLLLFGYVAAVAAHFILG